MHILITGSAGALGSHTAERLVREGHTVVGVDALTDYYDPNEKQRTVALLASKGVETQIADLATADLSAVIPDTTEFIVHFAAQPGIASSVSFDTYEHNNVRATARLLERAATLPTLKGFLHISTSSVYGAQAVGSEEVVPRPTSLYGVTKLTAEQLALSYARRGRLSVAVARLFSVYGERERPDKLFRKLIGAILAEKSIPLYAGSREHKRSFTYVDDIVNGLLLMIEQWGVCEGQIFNLGTDEVHTTGEAIDVLEELMGTKGLFEAKPPREGDQTETAADITKARSLLGYAPRTTLAEGLAREVAWCRDQVRY